MSWTRASSVSTGGSEPRFLRLDQGGQPGHGRERAGHEGLWHGDRRALWQGDRRELLPNGGSEGLLGVRAHGDGGVRRQGLDVSTIQFLHHSFELLLGEFKSHLASHHRSQWIFQNLHGVSISLRLMMVTWAEELGWRVWRILGPQRVNNKVLQEEYDSSNNGASRFAWLAREVKRLRGDGPPLASDYWGCQFNVMVDLRRVLDMFHNHHQCLLMDKHKGWELNSPT